MVGDGIVCLGMRVVFAFTNWKLASSIGRAWRSLPVTRNARGAKRPALAFMSIEPGLFAPSSFSMKSLLKEERRNSPSVIACRPIDSW